MATRYQTVTQLTAQSALDLTKRRGNWTRFLETAAKLYKYPFPDQLAIYAQRPDASACAPIETWNKPFGRFVRRGAKGIALIDDSGQYPRLKYVFDLADTEPGRSNPRSVNIWQLRPEHEGPVLEALSGTYGNFEGTLADALYSVAVRLAQEYYEDNARDIGYSAEGSFLEDYDELNLSAAFRDAATVGTAYCILARCGMDARDYFSDEDFQSVFDFNTESAIYALGTAVSEISERVLREIEITVKNYERQVAVERGADNGREDGSHLQRERGLSPARPDGGRAAGAADEVRHHAPELPQSAPDNIIQLHAAARDAARPSVGNTTGSGESDGAADETARGEGLGADGLSAPGQGDGSDGMGGAHEQLAPDSRGNGEERADIQAGKPGAKPEDETDYLAEATETPPGQDNEPEPGGVFEPAQYKYYSTQRPVDIGTYPRESGRPVEIVNYDERVWVENDTFRAWGHLVYDYPLTEAQISDYELRAAPDNPAPETYSQLGNTIARNAAEPDEPALSDEPVPAEPQEPPGIPAPPDIPPPLVQSITPSILGGVTISAMLDAARTPITLGDVDMVLRDGGNAKASLYRVVAFYMKDKGAAANADFLSREFIGGRYGHMGPTGKGFQLGPSQLSIWYDQNGLTLCRGKTARYERNAVTIPWEQAAARVRELLEAGQFASPEVLGGAIGSEYHELADRLVSFYPDMIGSWDDFPDGWHMERDGIHDIEERVAGLLADPVKRAEIAERLETDVSEFYKEHTPGRNYYRNPEQLLAAVRDTLLPLRTFPMAELPTPDFSRFITEDEVDSFLTRGGMYHEGKFRTFSFFLHNHTAKEEADYVKGEYGHSGQSSALGADGSWSDCTPGKGITLMRGGLSTPYSTVTLKWPQAATRIKKLIEDGRYMTRAELDRIPEYERVILARQINSFFHWPDKSGWPFPEGLNLSYPREADHESILEFLNNRALVDETLTVMKAKLDAMQPDDRHYSYDKNSFDRLTEYANGVYTLFPGLESVKQPEAVETRSAFAFTPAVRGEQLSLFAEQAEVFTPTANLPSVATQREAIETAEAAEQPFVEPAVMTQADIEDALRRWNGSVESKFAVCDAMQRDARSRATALFLQNEYGGNLTAFTVTKDGVEPLALTWARVQRQIAALMESGSFLTPEEQSLYAARDTPATETARPENEDAAKPVPFRETRPVGQSVLLPTVFDENGNFNRGSKRRRVTIAEPIGPYQIYTRPADYGQTDVYVMTGSGRLMYWSDANSYRFNLEHLDAVFSAAPEAVDDALRDPEKWIGYNEAAIANRLAEAETHNSPIRDARIAREKERHAAYLAASEAETKARTESFNHAIDEIANALVSGEVAEIPRGFDRNPLLALFALYEIDVPLSTKGWINRHVRAVQLGSDGRLMVRGDAKAITSTFASRIVELRVAIAETSPERRRNLVGENLDGVMNRANDEREAEIAPDAQTRMGETTAPESRGDGNIETIEETYSQVGNTLESIPPFSDAEIDALLAAAVENPKAREKLHRRFAGAPRSREAARLLREVYAEVEFTMPRSDGQPGYMGVLGEDTGVALAKAAPGSIPLSERPPAATLTLTWPKLHQRVAALAAAGRFTAQEQREQPMPAVSETTAPTAVPDRARGQSYAVGDTVYLEDKPYLIERISDISGEVTLRDPSLVYPISRAEGKDRFERLLRRDDRNRQFFDYVAADLDSVNQDLVDVMENWLFSDAVKNTLSELLDSGDGNYDLSKWLSRGYPNVMVSVTLETGETADITTSLYGMQIEILDKYDTTLGFSWDDIAPIVRALYAEGQLATKESEIAPDATTAKPAKPMIGTVREIMLQEGYYVSDELIQYAIESLGDGEHTAYDIAERLEDIMASEDIEGWERTEGRYSVTQTSDAYAIWDNENEDYYTDENGDMPTFADEAGAEMYLAGHTDNQKNPEQPNIDLFDEADLADVRERLQNPTPDDKARLDAMLEEAAAATRIETEAVQDDGDAAPLSYGIGDVVYLERNTAYTIYDLDDFDVQLRERGTNNPRFSSLAEFERLLRQNPANTHLYKQPETEEQARPAAKPVTFRITDDHLGEGGPKTKYNFNAAAIRTLKQVEAEGRHATPDEQEILSRFVGWGGIPQAFDAENVSWAKEYAELREMLTPDEYEMARASTINAHYTSPVVIRAMYETLERLGFQTGNILEPSCGVGNFFGLLPRGMSRAKLYGVELDGISGRIASMLYPNADIQVAGFEQTDMPDAFFDAVIGNVPFGDYPVADPKYKQHFNIHEYFFAKALDQVRPGGVVAFIASKYLMDKNNSSVRKYIAQRAELLGAVRLPNDAFLKNAGTETTTDIIFLKRRDRPIDIDPEWAHLGQLIVDGGKLTVPVNTYFVEHPEMILGRMALDQRMNDKYGRDDVTACLPIPGADLGQQLHAALSNITGQISEPEVDGIEGAEETSIPADLSVRNFSYALLDGALYYRENSRMYPIEVSGPDYDRLAGMIALRDCCRELITLQLDEHEDSEIRAKQEEMNALYDTFSAEHGLLNSDENARAFSGDSSYYLLCSLEILDDDGNFLRKADMFTKRTIRQQNVITSVDTAAEALAVSIGERASVDLGFMAQLMGSAKSIPDIVQDLTGVIFKDPATGPFDMDRTRAPEKQGFSGERRSSAESELSPQAEANDSELATTRYAGWQTADEYLSGNVREKLRQARRVAEQYPEFEVNVRALEQAQPVELEAGDISVRLGATWIDKSYVQQFMYDLLQSPYNIRQVAKVNYFEYTGEWQVTGKQRIPSSNVLACSTYGTKRANAYRIIEDTLNLRDVRIYDLKEGPDGKERRVLNRNDTTFAQERQELIRQKFKDWIWQDPERRRTLVALYNERFNSKRPREYDGSHITFSGMNIDLTMRAHQRAAVARGIYGRNALLAHDVGAGKTFEMAAIAMESKRLGLCQKSLIAVPNHLPGDFAAQFLRLYPAANLLVVTKKDFEMKNRRKFCARIATGDYDAVIIGHSQIEKIPISSARQERIIREQIAEIAAGIIEMKEKGGERFSVKQLEKTKKRLEARLERLVNATTRDDVVSFEQLGVDRLFVDEAHNYKNLFLYTKIRNVAGLSTADAQKSSDLFQKCRYLDELTGGKGVVFATGTPISNSMTEMYTMQRYLQYDALQRQRMAHFDSWASAFGETRTSVELAPEGSGYRARTRFARFENLPELMNMFKETADIKTAEMMDLPRPRANFHTVVAEPTAAQKEMVMGLSERAARVHKGGVDPTEDNMLKIITDGRKIGLDQRLANPLLPDDPQSKVNLCTENITRIWGETREKRLTQMVFCDYSTPKSNIWVADKKSTKPYAEQMKAVAGAYLAGKIGAAFNVYDDVKAKLILNGIPPEEIAFIHDADTDEQKQALFAKVRKGQVRVLLGSTAKVGVGTNVQDKLVALHDLDCPWRPADLQQRAGRIVRFGNQNAEVDIFRYVTNGTFDSYLWQTLENKQRFISQIMTGKSPVRTCEDVDEIMFSYAEIKAMCAGDPRIREKMDLDLEVARLRLIKSEHQNTHFRLQDDLFKHFPESVEAAKERIVGYEADIRLLETHTAASAKSKVAEHAPAQVSVTQAGKPGSAAQSATSDKPEPPAFQPMTILGVTYTDREKAGDALLGALGQAKGREQVSIGSYRGFDMRLSFDGFERKHILTLKGAMSYNTELAGSASGNLTRINNALAEIPERLKSTKAQLENLYQQVNSAREELKRPFPHEAELAEKDARLAVLNVELNIDGRVGQVVDGGAQEQDAGRDNEVTISAKSARPSILEGLRAGAYSGRNAMPDAAPDKTRTGEIIR